MAKSSTDVLDAKSEALKQLKKNLSDILSPHDTDVILKKWLRARNYNVRKTETFFRELHAFGQLYDLEARMHTFTKPEAIEKYEYTALLGLAKNGSLIRYSQLGKGDHYGFILSMSAYDLSFYCSYLLESDLQLQRKENTRTGKEVNEITYIFDLEGFCLSDILHKSVVEMVFDLGPVVQEYYPEVWGNIFIINVPPFFDKIFNIFKPMLRHSVTQKIQVITKDSVSETLLKYIDVDVLPVFLGGKKVDSTGNPRCTEFLRFGGKVPKKYHLSNLIPLSITDPDVTSVWISARAVYNYSVVVRKPNSKISVEFRTENGSIHLRVLLRNFGTDPESCDIPSHGEYLSEREEKTNVRLVSPGMRIQSHVAPVNSYCKAPWPGIYIFRFDNSHSWVYSRRLIFRIKLIEPTETCDSFEMVSLP